MRCLIYANNPELSWLRECFPDVDPYLLKIVNKPLLEYGLDLVSLMGVTDLRIVSDSSLKAMENYFKDGAKWGMKISYALARQEDTLKDVYLKNYSFCKEDDLLFWNGFFFVDYDSRTIKSSLDFSQSFCCSSPTPRLTFLRKGERFGSPMPEREKGITCLRINEVASVTDYYKLSMEILTEKNKNYVLPGYSNEKDTFVGLNLIYPHGSEVTPPIMIGNNCRFRNHTIIGSNTIVGDNVIIDENTSVTDSIVYDNTYIGCDLDLDKKLVYKNHLISAISGEFIYITDRVLVSQVELGIVTSLFNRFVQRVFALGIVLLQVIPWLLLYLPYSIFVRERRSEFLISKSLATKYCEDPSLVAKTAWGRFMLRLCLDKFALLLQASLNRKVYLVGNRLLTNTVQHRKLVMELPVYNPGAFSLAETTEANSPDVEQFYELEYINNISTRFNIIIICRLISSRLMHGYR